MKELEQIATLKKQLLDLGYRSYQIDDICRDVVGTCNISGLPPEQYSTLISSMEEYISFANKCLKRK